MTGWQKFKDKYLKFDSLTWWAGFVPLALGVLMMMNVNLPWIGPASYIVASLYGLDASNINGGALINIGLVVIGIRGALAGKTVIAAQNPVTIVPSTSVSDGKVLVDKGQ